MRSSLKKIIYLSRLALTPSVYCEKSGKSKSYIKWILVNGENRHRIKYNLGPHSVVFDVGGYKGDWSRDISKRYNCKIHIFEPISEFANEVRNKFINNREVKINQFGLGSISRDILVSKEDNASSAIRENNSSEIAYEKCKIVSIGEYIKDNKITSIDLMKINIEGGEYELLECMIKGGLLKITKNLQIQFHDFIPGAINLRENIISEINKTHSISYSFPFIWEGWKLKE